MTTKIRLVTHDWIIWLVMTLLGYIFGLGLCVIPSILFVDRDDGITILLFYSGLAAIVGLAQWFVIRRHLHQAGWWVLATAIGWPAGVWLGVTFMNSNSIAINLPNIPWITVGISLGLTQWLVLRKKVCHAEAWIIVSIVVWGLSGLLGDKVTEVARGWSLSIYSAASLIGLLTTWASAQSVCGLVLIWLLNQSAAKKVSENSTPSLI